MAMRAFRFKAPKKCWGDCKEVVVKELDGRDEIAAAVDADGITGQPGYKADNFSAMLKLERIAKIRRAIVSIDGVAVKAGEPCLAFDDFHAPTKLWIGLCFDKVNGLEANDLKESLVGEQVGSAPTTSEGAATGEPSGG